MSKRHGHKTCTWYAYIYTSKTLIHIKQVCHCCTKQMVASGHLCREDCQEDGHLSQRGGDTAQCSSQGPQEATEKGHRVTVLQRDENGGEKQGEKQVCTSRGRCTGIGVKVGNTPSTAASWKLPRLWSTTKGWQCLRRKGLGCERKEGI